MKLNIIKQHKNLFLHRYEYVAEVESNSTPSFADIKKQIGKDESLTIVKGINGNFGRHLFNVEFFVYDSKEKMDEVEKVPRKIRKKMLEEAKKAAPTPAAPVAAK